MVELLCKELKNYENLQNYKVLKVDIRTNFSYLRSLNFILGFNMINFYHGLIVIK